MDSRCAVPTPVPRAILMVDTLPRWVVGERDPGPEHEDLGQLDGYEPFLVMLRFPED
jgi:hypothetical protein